jgi:hypothetical protein
MEKEIYHELKQLREAVAKLVGTFNKPSSEQFSIEALEKAAKDFQKLSIERGEWVEESNIEKIIKSAPWRAGKFLREHFGFSNYFKKGSTYYYNKSDLQNLAQELKNRNVDLERYIEYLEDQAKFKALIEKAEQNKKEKTVTFFIPDDAEDITTLAAKPPSREIVKEDIKNLRKEFRQSDLDNYIDIYRDKYAMMKKIYWFDKYLEPGLKSRCNKWIKDFNYANDALEKVKLSEKERATFENAKGIPNNE